MQSQINSITKVNNKLKQIAPKLKIVSTLSLKLVNAINKKIISHISIQELKSKIEFLRENNIPLVDDKGKLHEILLQYDLLEKDKLICVAVRSPFDILHLRDAKTYICTFDCTIESLNALANALKTNNFSTKLPIKLDI